MVVGSWLIGLINRSKMGGWPKNVGGCPQTGGRLASQTGGGMLKVGPPKQVRGGRLASQNRWRWKAGPPKEMGDRNPISGLLHPCHIPHYNFTLYLPHISAIPSNLKSICLYKETT